uniref:Uncharacterized protein n=1 Tax=Rhizobium leguminosarum TaxID=384 RepID=A0A179BU89_RHILE|nr:hypothetical protein A4U53_17745 [Rhizobium leguminosarum]
MTKDDIAGLAWLGYVAISFVVFGFVVKSLIMSGPGALLVALGAAAFWPAAGLIWLGVWIA